MAQVYTQFRSRCNEHPHRETELRCSRCRLAYCDECLIPGERAADGTRGWFCAACTKLIAREKQDAAAARSLRGRALHFAISARAVAMGLAAVAVFGTLVALAIRYTRPVPHLAGSCGELTRIRSVGAIGVPSVNDVINQLAYPQRAEVKIAAAGTEVSGEALVDECDTGWRSPAGMALPVSVIIRPGANEIYVQRLTFWQDPSAPRETWIKDFEVLGSSSDSGDDFVPVRLDRPGQLQPTVEQQWFQVVQPAPANAMSLDRMAPQERVRYAQNFPDVALVRRLQIRVLTTYGSAPAGAAVTGAASGTSGSSGLGAPTSRPSSATPVSGTAASGIGVSGGAGVAIGEIAAYGADLEITIEDEKTDQDRTGRFFFAPREIRAISGKSMSVLFINNSFRDHVIVSGGQDKNLEVSLITGERKSVQFIASSRPGRYELVCRIPGHALNGLTGSISVR